MDDTTPTPPTSPTDGAASDNQHKVLAILGYIIPILFFIPLITDAKHNAFAKFHANQQLNLLIFWIAVNVAGIIPVLGWLVAIIGAVVGFVLMIMGIMNAAANQQKPLPLIGKIQLIK